jgi:hypothetical protein
MSFHFTDRHPGRWLAAALILVLAAAGCNSRKTHPVKGIVVFEDGAAAGDLAGGTVEFESEQGEIPAGGTIQQDGTFVVGTYRTNDGAVLGKHRVAVLPPPSGVDDGSKDSLQHSFMRFDTSGIVVTVQAGQNEFVIPVARYRR